jgi:hypothetical protein
MAKNRKSKKAQPVHRISTASGKHTKSYLETCFATARRIFRVLGEDPASFDSFSKRQKRDMFRIEVACPRIQAMPGHKVPSRYVRFTQDQLILHMKHCFFNEEAGLTWMDIITIGQSLLMVYTMDLFTDTLPPPQRAIVDRMCAIFEKINLYEQIQHRIYFCVKNTLFMISQPNFRIYGQRAGNQPLALQRPVLKQTLCITAHECQSLRFRYRNRERTAFRLAVGEFMGDPLQGVTIELRTIYPNSPHNRTLNVYIQSHALHRFKERIDTFYPMLRNQLLIMSIMISQIVVNVGGRQLIACITPHDNKEMTIGYFAFTIDGDNLLILTLLPLLSRSTPEGSILYRRLGLSTDDLIYLGMSKLSFFYDVDIAQIPALKKVLFDELHLEYIRGLYNSYRPGDAPFDEKKTLFVKNFFQKLEGHPSNPIGDADDDFLDF